MTDPFPALHARSRWNFIRRMLANFSLAAFLFAWPFITAYIGLAWFLVNETSTSKGNVAECLYFLGSLLLYVYPLVVWLKVKVAYAATVTAVLSARPLPILLAAVTWLSLDGLLPTGIIAWDGESGWGDAMRYSVLAILVSALAARTRASSSSFNALSQNAQSHATYPRKEPS